ncbi:MAG: ABC transporter ATP-binding protein [Deltaproteobacteria bacterium]|nr:ABC transporter ATP-binding protein [Deltaproteobacteria bacterium]MBI3078851.1 ABC transporter ATP-binding protein [Deltaproteobacteria bacterium]
MLRLEDVHTYYGNIHALRGVSLEVEEGEIVCLIGANGAGKSTTLMTISGVLRPARGRVLFGDEEIQEVRPDAIVARGICQVPEGRRIFPRLTVRENLEMGAFLRHDHRAVEAGLERVFTLFPVLRERVSQLGGTLSGGEQQMLAIARALMASPRLLLLDEPSLGLAPLMVQQIYAIIREINAAGTTIFLVEQNAHMALRVARRGYVMETGQVVLADRAPALLENEMVRKVYLGEV